jgi:hypothetical protein
VHLSRALLAAPAAIALANDADENAALSINSEQSSGARNTG